MNKLILTPQLSTLLRTDEVIAMLSDDSTEEENEFDDFQAYTVTRSGRVVGSWKNAEMYL